MTTKRLLALLLTAVAATVTFARARRATDAEVSTRTFEVVGVVTAAPAEGRITVAHNDIPGYMPAMTMPLYWAEGAGAAGARRSRAVHAAGRGGWVASRGRLRRRARRWRWRARRPRSLQGRAQRLKKGDVLPVFSLTTEAGRRFTHADLRGRVTAVTFIFTRCPVPEFCPLMVKRFQQVQRELERDPALRDVRLLSVTLDPAFDTPAVLAAYANAMGAHSGRWQFVTGEPTEIARFTNAFSIHVERNGAFIDHTLATAIVDGDGRVVEIWRGNGWRPADILEGLHRATDRRP